MKNLDAPKNDKKLKERKEFLETDQVSVVEKMNRIKIDFLKIKSDAGTKTCEGYTGSLGYEYIDA